MIVHAARSAFRAKQTTEAFAVGVLESLPFCPQWVSDSPLLVRRAALAKVSVLSVIRVISVLLVSVLPFRTATAG